MRIAANEVLRLAVKIREVASPSSGNKNLLTRAAVSLQNRNLAPALTCFDRAHQSGCAASQDQSIKFVNYFFHQELFSISRMILSANDSTGILKVKLFAGED
jgi:hypothetical protein